MWYTYDLSCRVIATTLQYQYKPRSSWLCPRFYLKYPPYQQQQQVVVPSACTATTAPNAESVETKPKATIDLFLAIHNVQV
jgi:hypothetical protein